MVRNPQVEAASLDESGTGVGRVVAAGERAAAGGELEVHVADLLPGERAEVAIEHRSKARPLAWGRIVARLGEPSPDRVAPACPAFGACGGCAWQHLGYRAQLAAKRGRVVDALAGVVDAAAIAPVVPSPAELGYRNKGKYVVASSRSGLVLGAYAPRSHRVVDTAGCKVVAPVIDEVAAATRRAAEVAGLHAYDEAHARGELRYVIVRAADDGGALVVLVVTSQTRRTVLDAAAATLAAHPAVRGVLAMRNDRRDAAIVTDDVSVLAGQATLTEQIAGCAVAVGAGEFLQVNRAQAAAIYQRVAALALDGRDPAATSAVDLYSGLGGIALTLARAGARVDAVEIDAGACAALRNAAASGGLDVRVHRGDAASIAELAATPDVIVVNPPRKGLSAEARAAILARAPARIVYVSCGPDSLARDLAALAPAYLVTTVAPYDLMPGTAQVETVVRLDWRG